MDVSRLIYGSIGYEWQPEFSDRQKFRASHNQWFCGDPGPVTTGDIPETTDGLLSAFLRQERDWDTNLYQSVPIRGMCSSAQLSVLKAGRDEQHIKRLSLLDERCVGCAHCSTGSSCRRSFSDGPLNAHELYQALREKVSRICREQ